MKRFVINLSMLGPSATGLGVYAEHCARSLEKHLNCTIISSHYTPSPGTVKISSPTEIAIGSGQLAAFRRTVYTLWGFPREEDFIYTPTHHGIFNYENQIITILDLIPLHNPSQHRFQYYYFKYLLPLIAKRARAIFTISEAVKSEISVYYSVNKEKIFVVPCGIDLNKFAPTSEIVRKSEGYLLVVGASYPHKNIEELLENWHSWKGRYKLKIASSRGKHKLFLESLVRKFELVNDVEFLGYISDEELVKLYQNCSALVFPSLCEGFGMPPLEVMACGRPAIVSDIPVHKEIMRDAAIYVTPGNSESWRNAFNILNDEKQITAKVNAGLELVKQYTWERSGDKLLEALLTVEPDLMHLFRL